MITLLWSIERTHRVLLYILLLSGTTTRQTVAHPFTPTIHWTGTEKRLLEARSDENVGSLGKSGLPVQIAGIVGSWVIFDAIVVFLLLFLGRRLRRRAQASNKARELVALKPGSNGVNLDPSPATYYSNTGIPSPNFSRKMSWSNVPRGGASGQSSHTLHNAHGSSPSISTIDESIVSSDKRRAQEQMEFLYAAVMEDEERKMSATSVPISEDGEYSPNSPNSSTPLKSPISGQFAGPLSPRLKTLAPPPKSPSSKTGRLSRISNLSIFSPSRSGFANKLKSPKSASLRQIPISSPLTSPNYVPIGNNTTINNNNNSPIHPNNPYHHYMKNGNSASPPLSPRQYTPGPPPVAPGSENGGTATAVTETSSIPPPTGAQYKPVAMHPIYPPQSIDQVTSMPIGSATTTGTPMSTRAAVPAPLNLSLLGSKQTANTSGTLPFRQMHLNNNDNRSFTNYENGPLSAPPTKTTILERPMHGIGGGPRTGMPTPYSPYMPFSPVTPMTPSHVVTKKDRKRQEKANVLKVLSEDDMVASDEDMWGS